MKTITKILSLMLIFTLSISMMACSSYGKVEKALTDLGYAVVEGNEADSQSSKYEDVKSIQEIHVFSKIVLFVPSIVVVMEFKSTEDLVNAYKDSNTLQGVIKDLSESEDVKEIYNKLAENGFVCGNCLIISYDNEVYKKIAELNK